MGFSFKENLPNIITVSVLILGALVLSSIINPVFDTTMKTLTKTVYIHQKEGMSANKGYGRTHRTNNNKYKKPKQKKVIGGKNKGVNNRKGKKDKKKKNKKNKKKYLRNTGVPAFAASSVVISGVPTTGAISFCDTYKNNPSELEKKCNTFNKSSCGSSSCCVWLNGEKCVAGDENGPTFHTTNAGIPINVDYYYYMNKCKGKC